MAHVAPSPRAVQRAFSEELIRRLHHGRREARPRADQPDARDRACSASRTRAVTTSAAGGRSVIRSAASPAQTGCGGTSPPRHGVPVSLPGLALGLRVGGQFSLPAAPLLEDRVAQRAGGVGQRPARPAGDIEDAAALGVLTPPVDDRLLDRRIDDGFGGGLETGPDDRPAGPEHERGRQPAPIRDPARGQHRSRRYQIYHRRHERQRRPPVPCPVPARLRTLRHDHVGPQVHRLPGLTTCW